MGTGRVKQHADAIGTAPTKKGHLRITTGTDRHKYVHRAHVEKMLKEVWHPYFGNTLPVDMIVHHQDGNKQHNCHCNYLIISPAFHGVIEQSRYVRDSRGRYKRILKRGQKQSEQ